MPVAEGSAPPPSGPDDAPAAPPPPPNRARRDLAAIALAATLFLVPGYPRTELSGTDEARYTQVAREMRLDGRWLAPRLNGIEYREKPALFFDLLQIPQRLTGRVTPLGSRLVILPFAILALWGTYGAGRLLAGRRAGLLSAACLGTNALFVQYANLAVLDVPLLACSTAALLAYLAGTRSATPPRRWRLAIALAMGAGCLFKGPVAILLPGAVIALDALWRDRGRALRAPAAYWVPALALLILVLPYIPLALAHPDGFADFVATVGEKQIVKRTVAEEAPHERPFWYYIPNLAVAWLPWTLLIPVAWVATGRAALRVQPDPRDESPLRFPFLWAATMPVVLSLIAGKRTQYLLPAAAGFSIWMAIALDGALARGAIRGRVERGNVRVIRIASGIAAGIGVLVALAAPLAGAELRALLAGAPAYIGIAIEEGFVARLGLEGAVIFAFAAWLLSRPTPRRLLIAMLAFGVLLNAMRHWEIHPYRDRFFRANEFGAEIRGLLDRGGEVGIYAMRLNGTYLLHSGATEFRTLGDEEEIEAFLAAEGNRAVIGKRRYLEEYIWPHLDEVEVIARHRDGRSEVVLFRRAR